MVGELQAVNEELWEIEDEIRACEAQGDFGPRFVELARSVYRSNDRRSAIKRRINEASGSAIVEEKLYRPRGHSTAMIVFYLNLARRTDRRERFLSANATIAASIVGRPSMGRGCERGSAARGVIVEPLKAYTPGLWVAPSRTGVFGTIVQREKRP